MFRNGCLRLTAEGALAARNQVTGRGRVEIGACYLGPRFFLILTILCHTIYSSHNPQGGFAMSQTFRLAFSHICAQTERFSSAKNYLLAFRSVVLEMSEFEHARFINVHADGIEILVGQDHRSALEQALSQAFRCCFIKAADNSYRSIATASVDLFAELYESPQWSITLITPISLNLEAKVKMFEQLRDEYGLGEQFRTALERRGVVPPSVDFAGLWEIWEKSLGARPEPVGAESIASFPG